MTPSEKAVLTKAKATADKWRKAYIRNANPWVTDKYIQAQRKLNALMIELKIKYQGQQLSL